MKLFQNRNWSRDCYFTTYVNKQSIYLRKRHIRSVSLMNKKHRKINYHLNQNFDANSYVCVNVWCVCTHACTCAHMSIEARCWYQLVFSIELYFIDFYALFYFMGLSVFPAYMYMNHIEAWCMGRSEDNVWSL